MEIKGPDYHVTYNPDTALVTLRGSYELPGMKEYAPIVELLNEAVKQKPATITLDMREVNFMNSSALSMILKFGINIRNKKASHLVVLGTKIYPWQSKSLKNIKRFVRNAELKFEEG
jgi:hypothetical protein